MQRYNARGPNPTRRVDPTRRHYTIGQLAASAGVPVSTVRYYERAGLLRPDARTGGNYRSYSSASLARLRFIRAAQGTGFSLKDIRELLGLAGSDDPPCDEVESVTRKRLAEVRARIKELRHVESVLAKSLAACCNGESLDLCNELGRLAGKEGVCRPAVGKTAGRPLTLHQGSTSRLGTRGRI